MTMTRAKVEAKMKEVCANCAASSVAVYVRNLYRLAGFAGKTEVPKTSKWLASKALQNKVARSPLNVRRILTVAGVKGMKMYKQESSGEWGIMMGKATEEYEKQRDARRKTKREKERWPAKGYDSLKDISKKLKKENVQLINQKKLSARELYRLQKYVIITLYSEHALRLDWADVRLGKTNETDKNFLYKYPRKGWTLTMRKYKTSKSMGEIQLKLSRVTSMLLSMFVPKVQDATSHGFLLSTMQGKKLSRSGLSKVLIRLTEKHLGSRIGSQIIRVLKSTKFRQDTEKSEALAKELMHSSKQQLQYAKK